jgi:hypothetical protein
MREGMEKRGRDERGNGEIEDGVKRGNGEREDGVKRGNGEKRMR